MNYIKRQQNVYIYYIWAYVECFVTDNIFKNLYKYYKYILLMINMHIQISFGKLILIVSLKGKYTHLEKRKKNRSTSIITYSLVKKNIVSRISVWMYTL